jgi:hypothetical protein
MKKYLILRAMNMNTHHYEIPLCYFEYTHMSLSQRLHFHFYHTELDNPVQTIHKAIKALGTNIFKWEIMDETTDEQEAQDLVKYYIHEYQSDVIGYNENLDPNYTGENNPRYEDHRTWEEIHGKEKAEQLKAQWSEKRKGHPVLAEHGKRRLEVWNPMDDPKLGERFSRERMGANNPNATHNYIFTKGEETFSVSCLKDFCRENADFNYDVVLDSIRHRKKYKGWMVRKEKKVDKGENKE